METLVREVVSVEGSLGAAPSFWSLPLGRPLPRGLIRLGKALGAHGDPGAHGSQGGGPGQPQAPGGGAHAFLYELPPGSPAQATLPGPDPPPGPEHVGGTDQCSCGHPQTRPRPNAGEASVVKWSTYFWPKIDFI